MEKYEDKVSKKAYTRVSRALLEEFLRLPDDIKITSIREDSDRKTLLVLLDGDGLPEKTRTYIENGTVAEVEIIYTKIYNKINDWKIKEIN